MFLVAVYAALIALGFAGLSWGMAGMWVYFAPGTLTLIWVAALLVLTVGLAALDWTPPVLAPRLIWLGLAATACAAILVLQGFANSADEYAYLFQAQTYLTGHLWNPAPPLGQALGADYTWVKDGKWVGQYPPGWPAILAVFGWTGWPFWAVNSVLAAAVGGLMIRQGAGRTEMALLMVVSPYFIFTGASYHSHMSAALLGVVAVICLEHSMRAECGLSWPQSSVAPKYIRHHSLGWAVLAGMALGGLGLIRYISAALIALPFAVSLVINRKWSTIAAVGMGCLPLALVLLWYHAAITGDPFKPVYWMGGRTADHLYFDAAGIAEGVRISGWRWVELVEWAGPGLVPLWLGIMAGKVKDRRLTAVDLVFPLFVLTFLFYPFDGANRYGPRYYFEAFPFLLLALRGIDLGPMGKRLACLSVVYSLVAVPFLGLYYRQMISERMDLYTQVQELGIADAVVLVKDGPGQLWKMEPDDMARNGLTADGPVLYARADKTDEAQLHETFPNRTVWVYQNGKLKKAFGENSPSGSGRQP